MCEDQHAPRSPSTNPGTRSPIAKHSIKVYCQNIHKFHSNAAYHSLIHKGAENRLKELFARVAKKAKVKIHVIWTGDAKTQKVANRDIVIYFVKDFDNGLIKPYLEKLIRTTTGSERRDAEAALNKVKGSKEGGLTFRRDTTADAWTIAEVYVDTCFAAVPQTPGATNYKAQLETWTGRMMGNAAFHEAMHVKVDPLSGATNIHGTGGGGLANPKFGYDAKATNKNIAEMAKAIKRLRPPYILGKTQPPKKKATKKKAPARKKTAPRLDTTVDPDKLF